ncbi:hypothetical protein GCM10025778_15810 [Paeniglutamicibacter antarcticus]|uniref:PepSY domain-containing protein n=2 Tax=Paeniglutamicibacter antarcticus TaxID=494023 RepID=A0ABP9TMF5_9MICC
MKCEKLVLAVCLALSPAKSRAIRREQWAADLRDCAELEIPRSALLIGALRSSTTARIHDIIERASKTPSHATRGINMRSTIGILAMGLTIVSGAAVGIHEILPSVQKNPHAEQSITGNATQEKSVSIEPDSLHFPPETLIVNTASDNVLDAFDRARDTGMQVTLVSDKRYSVTIDPSMSMDSVAIIDVKSGSILDSFPMNNNGLLSR